LFETYYRWSYKIDVVRNEARILSFEELYEKSDLAALSISKQLMSGELS